MWLFVANPTAHSGEAGTHIAEAEAALRALGTPYHLLRTLPNGATVGLVAEALRSAPYVGVLILGGDGTFHEVANGVLAAGLRLPIVLVPAGTGNNQARSLGLPLENVAAAVALVRDGVDSPMDAGRVEGEDAVGTPLPLRYFFDSVGFGFSARALHQRYADRATIEEVPILRDLYRDALVYAGAVTQALVVSYLDDLRFDAVVTTEHGTILFTDLVDLVVNNTRIYARAWVIDGRSRHDDGRMELVPIHGRDEWLARAIVDLDGSPLREWLEAVLPEERPLPATRFDIELQDHPMGEPVAAQVDGELGPWFGRVRIEVVPGALVVRVPVREG